MTAIVLQQRHPAITNASGKQEVLLQCCSEGVTSSKKWGLYSPNWSGATMNYGDVVGNHNLRWSHLQTLFQCFDSQNFFGVARGRSYTCNCANFACHEHPPTAQCGTFVAPKLQGRAARFSAQAKELPMMIWMCNTPPSIGVEIKARYIPRPEVLWRCAPVLLKLLRR